MKTRKVVVSDDAQADLVTLYEWIADAASPDIALRYVERLEAFVRGFDVASERGTARSDLREGLRITGFKRRVTVAFNVTEDLVEILRFFYGGQNWQSLMSDDPDLQ